MIANDQDSQVKEGGLLRRQTDAQSMVNQVIVTVGVCRLGVGRLQHKPYGTLPMSTKICATPVLVNASQACTGTMIVLQGLNIDALLPAVNLI